MTPATQTPASSFGLDVERDIRSLEREGARAAMETSQKRTDEKLTRLRGDLILAWRNLVEESSISESLEVIAADIHNLAAEFGKFSQQERYIIADRLFRLSEAAGRAQL